MSDLIAIGFTQGNDGALNAPKDARVKLIPIGRFFELHISLGDGDAVTVVVPRIALKIRRHGVKL